MEVLSKSPFVNHVDKHLNLAQKIQIALMSVFVAPIRAVCIVITLMIASPFASIVVYKQDIRNKPITGWRRAMFVPIKWLSRAVYFFGGMHWVSIYGKPEMDVPIMVAAPHHGYLDSLLFVVLNFTNCVARYGTEEIPVFGPLVKMCQPIIVNREKYESRTDTVQRIVERANSKLGWSPTVLFPEGTTTNGKAIVQFKPGAFIPGLPIQPVCVKYFSMSNFDSWTWTWKCPSVYALAWYQMCQLHTRVEYHFLPVYNPSEEEKRDANLFADNVRKTMATYMNIAVSEYSYEDAKLMTKVFDLNLPGEVGLIKMTSLRKKHNINNFDDVYNTIPVYAKMASRETGLVYLTSFAEKLGLKECESINRLFNLFDNNNGHFNYATFIEVYFEHMASKFNDENIKDSLSKVLDSLDKFKSNQNATYSFEQLNAEFRQKFKLEYLSVDRLELGNQKVINKKSLENHFRTNLIELYLFSSVLPK